MKWPHRDGANWPHLKFFVEWFGGRRRLPPLGASRAPCDPAGRGLPLAATLRYRLLHAAARLIKHSRHLILRIPETWPWANEFADALNRVRAIP